MRIDAFVVHNFYINIKKSIICKAAMMMDARNAKRQKTYYNSQFYIYGYDPRSLGWYKGTQPIRFKNLAMIGELDECSVLDVGCGFGDLYEYLLKNKNNVRYTGIDINRNFIKTAREVYPDAQFIEADFEEALIRGKFDWAFASGIFNLKIDDNKKFIERSLEKMFKLCRKGLAADFLDAKKSIKTSGLYYQDKDELLQFCHQLTGRVQIRDDYLPSDFCIYLYKDDTSDQYEW
jgi:SAM-dependent methyltransferase